MLAGALKDNGRARIVGERTFGKGLIQTIVELSDGSGVAVTVARYQTPAGTDINKVRALGLPCAHPNHGSNLDCCLFPCSALCVAHRCPGHS